MYSRVGFILAKITLKIRNFAGHVPNLRDLSNEIGANKRQIMKKAFLAMCASALIASCCPKGDSQQPSSNISPSEALALSRSLGSEGGDLLERGVLQTAALWRESDGDYVDFESFVKDNYAATPKERRELFDHLSHSFELINGAYNQLALDLQKPSMLASMEPLESDYIFSSFSPSAHLDDDLFANKIAFLTTLNFPHFTLEEKDSLGREWSREQWAYARMGDMFTERVSAEVNQQRALAESRAENYIASYNIMMGSLLSEDGRRLFPEDLCLLSHWNLRDELKACYALGEQGLEKQEMIFSVMQRIISQEIPAAVINSSEYDWMPVSNRCYKDGKEVKLEREKDERYSRILEVFHAYQQQDKCSSSGVNAIGRNFEEGMEVSDSKIESLFKTLLSSPQVAQVASLIESRLGRPLRPFDIWYDAFKARTAISESSLTDMTRSRYPDSDAYKKDMPRMFRALGFSASYADFLASKIEVENARGSGHAWGTAARGYNSFLRTRIGEGGMDYKGYNIAVHEMGHNVEQTIDMYDIDYYTLAGVPNTAFTETLAFIFQKRDLQLLGLDAPLDSDNMTLDIFWGMYEIMGVSLVDMYTWRWLYAHPQASSAELREAVMGIAAEVWDEYYAPVLGQPGCTLLAVYSHMVNSPMYLPNYPYGHIVEYQIESYLKGLENPRLIAPEVLRIWKCGRLTPDRWMNEAVGSDVSVQPILDELTQILAKN